jgi:acyl-CoA synthetase (AMP-forming)/AMP-acid ligase II
MKGYLKNRKATEEAFAGGWFRSGDLAVWHPEDRSKDMISGGENISSLEVEKVLAQHPAIMNAAVVARPDPTWGDPVCISRTKARRGDACGLGNHYLLSLANGALQSSQKSYLRRAS